MDAFSFAPDGAQAQFLDRRMRLSLADSLDHIREQARGHLPFDEPALRRMTGDMRAGSRYPMSTFGLYAQTVLALCEDDGETARALLARLVDERPLAQAFRVLSLDDPVHAAQAGLYQNMMDGDPTARFDFDAPPAETAAAFRQRFGRGFKLMSAALPGLAAEFAALVSDVLMVVGDPKATYQFDGGSSYMLWGGLFLNATSHTSDIAIVEVLAHESAHILLYGCAADEALVANDDADLYPSPLRVDLRPMDGIYHATFVSARMHWAMTRLIESGLLDEAGVALAQAARQADRDNFRSGHGVVAEHGKLTATGARVMGAAKAYMDSV